jgi:hypothetical protein
MNDFNGSGRYALLHANQIAAGPPDQPRASAPPDPPAAAATKLLIAVPAGACGAAYGDPLVGADRNFGDRSLPAPGNAATAIHLRAPAPRRAAL